MYLFIISKRSSKAQKSTKKVNGVHSEVFQVKESELLQCV